ncbi:glutamate--tRNA ligase [bacterium]|nr:glutamate--tRNA ligase [bacterium]
MPSTTPRVRFAPSPTGMLHVGGARTALFNWLFARHTGGTFILRIEDTDRARFNPDALADLTESLRWLGLDWDEGPEAGGPHAPYFQSERTELYRRYAQQLVDQGHAYKCFCTSERLEQMRKAQEGTSQSGYDKRCRTLDAGERARLEASGAPFVIRFAVPPDGATVFTDLIRGGISYPNAQQDDFVLLKSDGFPTYHLANVVDDHLMEITHVMRGEEWIPSTPKHVLLYERFGWAPPVFAHLPVILAPGGGKLSKRHGAAAVSEYRAMGYLPEALVNFLALLGWAVSGDEEIVPRERMIAGFEIERINKTSAQFNRDKLDWMNGQYIRQCDPARLIALCRPLLEQAGLLGPEVTDERLRFVMKLAQERMQALPDCIEQSRCFLADDIPYDDAAVQKFLRKEGVRENLEALRRRFAAVEPFEPKALEECVTAYLEESGQPLKKVVHPLRVAVTGRAASPGIYETLCGIGRERVLRRLDHVITRECAA